MSEKLSWWPLDFARRLLRESPTPSVEVIVKEPLLISEEQAKTLAGKKPQ